MWELHVQKISSLTIIFIKLYIIGKTKKIKLIEPAAVKLFLQKRSNTTHVVYRVSKVRAYSRNILLVSRKLRGDNRRESFV